MKGRRAGVFLLVWCIAQSVAFIPSATAQTGSFAQRIYGMWYTYPVGNSATDSIRHEFRHNSEMGKDEMIVSRICQGDDTAVIARVAVPIEVTENTIKILQSASRTEKKGTGADCQASIESAVWGYVISSSGDRLSITNPGGAPDLLQLARQDLAVADEPPASVYGTWLLPPHQERGATVEIKLIFYESANKDRGKIRQISTCSKANDSVLSQADSTFKITTDHITVLEAASHHDSNGSISCVATISPGTLHYAISPDGSTMVLSKPGAPPLNLTREP